MKKASKAPTIKECLQSLCDCVRRMVKNGIPLEASHEAMKIVEQSTEALSRRAGPPRKFDAGTRRKMAAAPGTCAEVARQFGCHARTVSNARKEFDK